MYTFKKRSDFSKEKLLSFISKSKKEFLKEYKEYDEAKARELYFQILTEICESILVGNVKNLERYGRLIECINGVKSRATLRTYFNNIGNPIRNTNLVIMACKFKKSEVLDYLFSSNSSILNNLSIDIENDMVLPHTQDDEYHNCFYYAIRTSDIKILTALINNWPGDYFIDNYEELDQILSKAYMELKLKNIFLTLETQFFVENKLIDLRFFSEDSNLTENVKTSKSNIKVRISIVLNFINILRSDFSSKLKLGAKFLYITNSIAQNIHVLKQQLKSTYDKIPWEEIEFCLVCFVSSHTKPQEMNFYFRSVLTLKKILLHLENFAQCLQYELCNIENLDLSKATKLPPVLHEKVVADIYSNYPSFSELYYDYQLVRDVYSLEKMRSYIHIAVTADTMKKEGQLIIMRTLQVIAEHLKNTLASPKLSSATSELLLLSIPHKTREIIIALRNSVSHSHSFCKRLEIEDENDNGLFRNIQDDIKKIGTTVVEIIFRNLIKTIRELLKKFVDSESLEVVKEMAEIFNCIDYEKMISVSQKISKQKGIEDLVEKLNIIIGEKTNYERELFDKINTIINFEKNRFLGAVIDYESGFISLKGLFENVDYIKLTENRFKSKKFIANGILKNITSKIKPMNLKEISELCVKVWMSARPRLDPSYINEMDRLGYEIFHIAKSESDCIKWIEEYEEKLSRYKSVKDAITMECEPKNSFNLNEEDCTKKLKLRLTMIKNILTCNGFGSCKKINKDSPFKKCIGKLLVPLEMLVLDVMSILDSKNDVLRNNLFFLDHSFPLLTGKCLYNHLTHDNALMDVMSFTHSWVVISNAERLAAVNLFHECKRIGEPVKVNLSNLKEKYHREISIINNQEKMFLSLEEGNIEDFIGCLKKGADTNARNINLWTTLHFASKGPCLELVKFLLDQNLSPDVKDINGQTSLHIAAAFGRKHIVVFFVEERKLDVDLVDLTGKTPLHFAALNGHKDVVEVLLKNKSITSKEDNVGLTAMHYAVQNNFIDVVKVLFEHDKNMKINETKSGFTALSVAEEGFLEMVNYLLKNGADPNAKSEHEGVPLHSAAFYGHLKVVKTLISHGADVNIRAVNGSTPLRDAVENGHENIVKVLLENGAIVNSANKMHYNIPLHYAAKYGHKGIVETLIEYGSKVHVSSEEGITPLHIASERGHKDIVWILLKNGAIANSQDSRGLSSLHLSSFKGHKDVVKVLLKNGADTNARDKNGGTPLHLCAVSGQNEIAELLISAGAVVEAKDNSNSTPLHISAINGHKSVLEVLINAGADVNIKNENGWSSLHLAVGKEGNVDVIECLISKGAKVDAKDDSDFTPLLMATLNGNHDALSALFKGGADIKSQSKRCTPLHIAIIGNHKDIMLDLIERGIDINCKDENNMTPLCIAVKQNYADLVKILISKGANVNLGQPIKFAVLAGYNNIVQSLLNVENIIIHGRQSDLNNTTFLHLAALKGNKDIVQALLTKGMHADIVAHNNATPLHCAVLQGYKDVAEVLLLKGADVNHKSSDGDTPLHVASSEGHNDVLKLLLHHRADVNMKDRKNRTALELAVANGHLPVVKTLLQCKEVNCNSQGSDGWNLLHIAAQAGKLDIVKLLVDKGVDSNSKNRKGSKPVHIAAKLGHKNVVEYFLDSGCNIDDCGASGWSLLHYASSGNCLEVAKYLIKLNADVDAVDKNGMTPMHVAADDCNLDIINLLLSNGAIYNSVDRYKRKPLDITVSSSAIKLLSSTEKLFGAVKQNNPAEIEDCLKEGAFIDAKNSDNSMALHHAAWKGYKKVSYLLLKNKANPNVIGKGGYTPLHYAAKFGHFSILKALLSNGAIYNIASDNCKTPLDFAEDQDIISLLKLVDETFKGIRNCNPKVLNDLKQVKDIEIGKAVMRACNRDGKSLIVDAIHNGFPKVEELKQMFQENIADQKFVANILFAQDKFHESYAVYKVMFEERKEILGPDNPGTLDIQRNMAKALYRMKNYEESLKVLQEVCTKLELILGEKSKDTLNVKIFIAIVLNRMGKKEEALKMFEEIYPIQKEVLAADDDDVIDTQYQLGIVLAGLEKYEQALSVSHELLKTLENYGPGYHLTLATQHNIALVLYNQGRYEESMKMYEKVYETRKTVLGPDHSDTCLSLHNMAGVFSRQGKLEKAMELYQEVLKRQIKTLGPDHLDTLNTKCNIGNVLFSQGKYIDALKAYKESLAPRIAILGTEHSQIQDTLGKIKIMKRLFKLECQDESEEVIPGIQNVDSATRTYSDDVLECVIKSGINPNSRDKEGRTPLHYGVYKNDKGVVTLLLRHGADATKVTNKGNTVLHTATSNGNKEMVDILLRHVKQTRSDKLNDFVNSKTSNGGSSALHVAARDGSLNIVKSLLEYGAIYNITDNKGKKAPLDYSKNLIVTNLLKLIEELFNSAQNGDPKIISKLKELKPDEFAAIVNARNIHGQTAIQVASINKHKDIASLLIKMLQGK